MWKKNKLLLFTICFFSLLFHSQYLHSTEFNYFSLEDFYSDHYELRIAVNFIMNELTDEEKISQMVMTACGGFGKSFEEVLSLIEKKAAGGVVFLGNRKEDIERYITAFREASEKNSLLLPLYAVDGEPSLINERIWGIKKFPQTATIKTEEQSREVAREIAMVLREIGIHINYAPVCDFSQNSKIIGLRSFGSELENVSVLTETFMKTTQENGIVATAKHFPGHGTVEGDTHWELVFIDGEPPEIPVFKNVIDTGIVSIMVGHIGVINQEIYGTDGKPSTLSPSVVTDLLRNTMGFRGIIVTDAMNMEAVKQFDFPSLAAVKAGCDMVLMPENESNFIDSVLREINENAEFRAQVMESVRKIIRLKICLGLVNYRRLPLTAFYLKEY